MPNSDKTTLTNNIREIANSSVDKVLKVAGIYGANASGKSNVVKAMHLLRFMVAQSALFQVDQLLPAQPFKLDQDTREAPTELEIAFIVDKIRYQYGFSFTSKQVISEWLDVYVTSKPQSWFSREFDSKKQTYEYHLGTKLAGAKTLWRDATRPNSLFLSTAIQLNSEQLKPVFDWITKSLIIFGNNENPDLSNTVELIKKRGSASVKDFLAAADIAIENIELKSYPGFMQKLQIDPSTGQLTNTHEEHMLTLPTFSHSTKSGNAVFEFMDESDGTQKLFALAGTLFEILEKGLVLIIDELDRSLHTFLVRHLIELFQSSNVEEKMQAQLIFTSHDTSILQGDLLRRDQIWFTEKDDRQASKLFPLTDFAPRKNEAFERGYLSGRYGAVPILDSWNT